MLSLTLTLQKRSHGVAELFICKICLGSQLKFLGVLIQISAAFSSSHHVALGPLGILHVQGFLALLGYAAIARFAALQFLGDRGSLAAAATVGLAMDMSGLLFIYAHRMLACSYAAACQSAAHLSSSSSLRDGEEKLTIHVPRALAAVGYIFMSEQPAIPAAQV